MKLSPILLAVSLLFGATSSNASTFDVISYSPTGHSMYLFPNGGLPGGLGRDYHFAPDPGQFEFVGGMAFLTGFVESETSGPNGYEVNLKFDYNVEPDVSYKEEQVGSLPGANPVVFMNLVGGTLTGKGSLLEGLVLDVTRRPEDGKKAAQFAIGGHEKGGPTKDHYGMAVWFTATVSDQSSDGSNNTNDFSSIFGKSYKGDFNVLIKDGPVPGMPPVPLPAAGWMLIAGIGGLAAMGRRRRKAAAA